MRGVKAAFLIAVVSLLFAGTPASAQPAFLGIDPSKGSVDGMTAMAVWPRVGTQTVDTAGFEVVLVRRDDPAVTIRFPAATWQVPPEGSYRIFLEGKDVVSPYPTNLTWSRTPFSGRGQPLAKQFVPAGRVRIATPCEGRGCRAWLLMPIGSVAAGTYDSVSRTFLTISAPIRVSRGQTTSTQASRPKHGHSALILELVRPKVLLQRQEDDIESILVTSDGKPVPPSFTARAHNKLFVIWPDVPAGSARAELRSKAVHLPQPDIKLRSGAVEYIRRELADLPRIGVTMRIPAALRSENVIDLSGSAPPLRIAVGADEEEKQLRVPASLLKLILISGPWQVSETVDMTDGHDRTVALVMEVFRLSGHVYLGRDPILATIRFDTRDDWKDGVTVSTEADGRYEAFFTKARTYTAMIEIPGRSAPFAVPLINVERDSVHDFHVPANQYTFRVTNKHTGDPISGADISVDNHSDDFNTSQRLVTDSRGQAAAQPLRTGTVRVKAGAAGFLPSEAHDEPVSENSSLSMTFELEPIVQEGVLTLTMSDGTPAAGADVLVDPARQTPWMLTTDADGRVKIPDEAAHSLVLIRKDGGAFLARIWPGSDQRWTIEAPAPDPLVIRAISRGSPVQSFTRVLWLDGIRLSGFALSWLTRAGGMSDSWTLTNIPPRPLAVLLYKNPERQAEFANGLFDSMRTLIRYPWPRQIQVEVLKWRFSGAREAILQN